MIEYFTVLLENYPVWAPVTFFIIRMLPIVVPPVPGLAIDFLGLSFFDPVTAFLLAECATLVASMIAFYIGRVFREPVVRRFVSLQKVHDWEDRYSENKKFWTLVGIRFVSSPFFDYVSFAAGLTKMRAWTYFCTTFLGTLPIMIGIYTGGGVLQHFFGGKGLVGAFIFAVIVTITLGWFYWNKRKGGEEKGGQSVS